MKIYLESVNADFVQDRDGDDDGREMQTLNLEMTHCGAAPYLVLKTERWALDEVGELSDLLDRFQHQVEPLFARNEE